MAAKSPTVLQVSTVDLGGGAEKVARELFQEYRQRGIDSWLAVGTKRSQDPNVLLIPNSEESSRWEQTLLAWGSWASHLEGRIRGMSRLRFVLNDLSNPRRWWGKRRGFEDFNHPGTRKLLDLTPIRPDIIHCHNLHGGYFDLRLLPGFNQQIPVVLTLHDAWLLSGHCAHSFQCGRWKTGCGKCPDLTIYPAVKRDATSFNWQRKQAIFSKSRFYLATPSQWLMDKVDQSMLAMACLEKRVIPYGFDVGVFFPSIKQAARQTVNIPQDAHVLMFAATGIRRRVWRDYQMMRDALARVADRLPDQKIRFVALGEAGPIERIGNAEIHFVPFERDLKRVALYYQAADIYVHAARVDTFPNVVLEALACGTPVVATAVGGIPEQVKNLADFESQLPAKARQSYGKDEATGILVPPGDSEAMAEAIFRLLTDEPLLSHLSRNAALDARNRFNLSRQVGDYLDWYQEILEHHRVQSKAHSGQQ